MLGRLLILVVFAAGGSWFVVPSSAFAAPQCGVLQSGAAPTAQVAVQKACTQIGVKYAWAGGHGKTPGPTKGVCDASNGAPNDCNVTGLDCSGLTRYAYYLATGQDIISGPTWVQWDSDNAVARFSAAQGTGPLLPGDLLFFRNNTDGIHHTAMYLGNGWIIEAPQSGQLVQVAALSSHHDYYGAIRLFGPGGGASPPPAPGAPAGTFWVDTFEAAEVYASPNSKASTGTLNAGTNYVYCKAAGRRFGSASQYNHWWLRTDPDSGPAAQYVSAYYLSRWGNDEAKDNNGATIPDCAPSTAPPPPPPASGRFWVDTFEAAEVYASPNSKASTGTLNAGTNYVYCKAAGRRFGSASQYNHWWLRTDPDSGPAAQYVSAYYLSRWGNDEAKDNNGTTIPDC